MSTLEATPGAAAPGSGAVRRARWLERLTVAWNVAEAVVGIAAGAAAASDALLGFGLDSVVESLSALVLLWRLRDGSPERERRALALVGWSFVLLAAWIAFDAGRGLLQRQEPEASPVGIGLAIVSLVAMPILARAKRRSAGAIQSRALAADARQTDFCAYLSAILLVGLSANALLGWWWADGAAALVMVPIVAREGVQALRGEACDCGASACE